jgi:hypothetical protein
MGLALAALALFLAAFRLLYAWGGRLEARRGHTEQLS